MLVTFFPFGYYDSIINHPEDVGMEKLVDMTIQEENVQKPQL